MGIRLDIRCPRFPRPVGLPVDLPPHAPCHASPVVERQDYVSALCSLAHRTGALRLDAELHYEPFRLRIKAEGPIKTSSHEITSKRNNACIFNTFFARFLARTTFYS